MTQTKIAFTVDLEDAVEYTRDHIKTELDALKRITVHELECAISAIEQHLDNQGDLRHALVYLDNFRKQLAKHDTRILECASVLQGYHELEQPQNEQVAQPPDLGELQEALDKLEGTNE